jgi:membrane protein YqaA with SNARE-associated domain
MDILNYLVSFMASNEIIFLVLVDSFFSSIIFVTTPEFALYSALKLSEINNIWVYSASTIGVVLGSVANYILGIVVQNIITAIYTEEKLEGTNLKNLKKIFEKYGDFLLMLSFVPIYSKLIALFSGVARFSLAKTIFYIFTLRIISYVFY